MTRFLLILMCAAPLALVGCQSHEHPGNNADSEHPGEEGSASGEEHPGEEGSASGEEHPGEGEGSSEEHPGN